ncbi:hypothetical protein QUF80_02065 [Desulfococcaceae bacterium HSG8]|nr:hypothetical protein [Desulfococcaceae bacterium HSG8]
MEYRRNLGSSYSPLYFLASLGSGGLIVTFFMYLMFMMPHNGYPVPTFDILFNLLAGEDFFSTILIGVGVSGVIYFAFQHYRLLIWNIREYYAFKATDKFRNLKKSDAEVQLMAIPLTYAMSVNVMFILGALFVPSLWNFVEYLFPFALAAFLAIGVYAIIIFMAFMSRVIAFGKFDCEKNNSLSQMLSIFAFSMVAVGFSAGRRVFCNGQFSHQQRACRGWSCHQIFNNILSALSSTCLSAV